MSDSLTSRCRNSFTSHRLSRSLPACTLARRAVLPRRDGTASIGCSALSTAWDGFRRGRGHDIVASGRGGGAGSNVREWRMLSVVCAFCLCHPTRSSSAPSSSTNFKLIRLSINKMKEVLHGYYRYSDIVRFFSSSL